MGKRPVCGRLLVGLEVGRWGRGQGRVWVQRGRWGALTPSQTDNAHRQQDPRCPRRASLQLPLSLWDEGGDRRKVTRREETARRGLDGRTVMGMCSLEGGAFHGWGSAGGKDTPFPKKGTGPGHAAHCGLPR